MNYSEEDIDEVEKLLEKSDLRQATIRTAVPAFWMTFIATAVARYTDWTVSTDDLMFWSPVIGAVTGVAYRIFRAIESRWPRVGTIIFGRVGDPTY